MHTPSTRRLHIRARFAHPGSLAVAAVLLLAFLCGCMLARGVQFGLARQNGGGRAARGFGGRSLARGGPPARLVARAAAAVRKNK